MSAPDRPQGAQRPDFLARFLEAVPLLVVYFGLAALYAWQASRHPVPTIFTDELELTQLARSIAETGEPARRGVPYGDVASLVLFGWLGLWAVGSIALIDAQDPAWTRPEPGTTAGDVRLVVIAAVIYAGITSIHAWLGYWPFPQ